MDKYGIIGWPVAHSLSPRLFSAAYNGKFQYELLGSPDFEECWKTFLNGGYRAVNVTAPYKEKAFQRADIVSDEVRNIGAANIIVKTPEGLAAHNSDYLGVRKILESLPDVHTACVIGFGGAGKAALAAVRSFGMEPVLLRHDGSSASDSVKPACFDIIICTLPKFVEWVTELRSRYLLEANYKDPCLMNAGIAGEYIPGRRWLLEQAVEGYGLMTGENPDKKAIFASLDI